MKFKKIGVSIAGIELYCVDGNDTSKIRKWAMKHLDDTPLNDVGNKGEDKSIDYLKNLFYD